MLKRKQFNWLEPSLVSGYLIVLSFAWILIAMFGINSLKYQVVLGTVGAVLIATAIILMLRTRRISSTTNFHESIVSTLFQSNAVALTLINHEGNIIELNDTSAHMLGYDQIEELIGKPIMTVIEQSSQESLIAALQKVKEGQIEKLNIHVLHRSAFPLELQISCEPVIQDSKVIGSLIVSHDLSDHKRNLERIRYMAYYDDMTGLPNRTLFQLRLDESLLRAKEDQKMLSVCYIDLDNFKLVNASFGREYADLMLLQMADRLNRLLSTQDFVARLEGDAFALLLNEIDNIDQLLVRSQHILDIISEPYDLKGVPVHMGASMGIALNLDPTDDGFSLFKKADMALVKVKESSGGHILIYSEEWNNSSYERLKLQHEIHRAIQRKEFELYYQPQYDLIHGRIVGVEALIRWNHPTKGLLSPIHFIPLAEESGLIVPIGEWVIREACRQNKEWLDAGLPIVPVAVNLSIRQFVRNEMDQQIKQILEETQLPSQYLDIEITESMSIDMNEMNRKLIAISELGVGISVDDFGTGYSSFHYLKSFPITRLKIDRSFVTDILNEQSHAEIVSAIIAMAHKLNLQVIAEGVETTEQLEFLRTLHCDEMQGYLKSPPIPGHFFQKLLFAG
ncbi:putative bifunctional diguanylate cyclase/phosphodiesterase [Paenibacillus endoradicis]|uniref:putative bifunctional diguanylate cyclase/phosphodiesterase n=1 Tax=Paenibacillus endoradicis TaxID=2972487 RepID=UPI002159A72E|nr:GGDEF domain-containing phosphodiesterase [Paenibacillus endoradicis]MCR8658936.1 EAL domain-containing protein [Paenibacillus endoradicis]